MIDMSISDKKRHDISSRIIHNFTTHFHFSLFVKAHTHHPPLEAFFHARKKCLVRSDMTELYARSNEKEMVLRRMKVKSSHYVSLLKKQNEIIIIKMMAWDLHRDWCTECLRECWTVSLVIILNFITWAKFFYFVMKWNFLSHALIYVRHDIFLNLQKKIYFQKSLNSFFKD